MLRKKTPNRGRVVPFLVAGGIGYLLGGWHVSALRGTDLSASEAIALRFPEPLGIASPAPSAPDLPSVTDALNASASAVAPTSATRDAQLVLFSPNPMVPHVLPQTAVQTAVVEDVGALPDPAASALHAASPVARPASLAKPAAAVAVKRRDTTRSDFVLNDAQIANIKDRLHLTPDQEQMWPAVEAALRDIAYRREQEARARGTSVSAAQAAAVDPDAVQGLKSAAVPLIMSFNAEQKDEVRNLAHVMGLDQLASQF